MAKSTCHSSISSLLSLFPREDFVDNKTQQKDRHDDQEEEDDQEYQPSLQVEVSAVQNGHERRSENCHRC
jgi:hypothetical protein